MNIATELDERYHGRTVLITGGSGFIGRHLARRLIDAGALVTSFARNADGARERSVEAVAGDIRDDAAVARVIATRFDYVFHLAAYSGQVPGYTDHQQSLTTNCLGLLNLLEATRLHSPSVRLCLASSRLVYGRTPRLPVAENHPREPLSLYGIHKSTAEDYCHYYRERWGIDSVVVRMSNPYGPHEPSAHNRYNVANWMADRIVAGEEVSIFGDGSQLRDYIYVDDAVDATLLAAAAPAASSRVYNVGSGAGTPLVSYVEGVIAAAGCGRYTTAQWPVGALQVETGDFIADIARVREELGWTPRVSLSEGIQRTVGAAKTFSNAAPLEVAA